MNSPPLHPTSFPRARQARGFDRLAAVYDFGADLALLGRIHASQIALLPRLPPIGRALVMGGGTGRFTAELLTGDYAERVVSMDISAGMTERTARRLAGLGVLNRADLRQGGVEELGAEQFDLIVTHCFLDLFEPAELAEVMARLGEVLRPRGLWLFSDFWVEGAGLPGWIRRGVVAALYAFFRFACAIRARRLPDFTQAFARAGLETVATASFAGGLLRTALLFKPDLASGRGPTPDIARARLSPPISRRTAWRN